MFHLLRQEAFHASVLAMDIDGKRQTAILRDVQVHPYKQQVLHLDFQRVDATHKIHVKVPLHFVNADVSPGVKLQGGVASHVMNELDVSCLPGDLPEFIEVDLAGLSAGHSLHVSQVAMPKGVEPVLHKGEDPVVAAIVLPRGAKSDEAAAEAAAAEAPKK
jgi:large subunit ribosomal protein L25